MDFGKFSLALILTCFIQPFINRTNGICNWPSEFQNTTWYDSSKGDLAFTVDKLTGWTITVTAVTPYQQFNSWLCHSTEIYSSRNILVLITEETFEAYDTFVYGYLCLELQQITPVSYRYYIHNGITSGVNNERIRMSQLNSESDWNTLCLLNDAYAAHRPTESEYRVLIDTDNILDAKIKCPYVFLGTYGYTHTDVNGTVSCDSSMTTWSSCDDVTDMTFDYTACSTEVAFSKSDTVWCVDTVSYNDDNYVTVYNSNDDDSAIDNVNTHRFSCFAISSDGTSASVAPGSCTNGQTASAIPSTGSSSIGATLNLIRTDTCVTCPNLQAPSGGSVSYSTNGAVTTASYTCSDEYSLAGSDVRTCQDNNTWTGEDPTCTCILPESPANGSIVASTDGTLTYSCDVGFVLVGDRTRTCQADVNTWSGTEPVCDPCEDIGNSDGLLITMMSTGTTSMTTFSCLVGYTMDGLTEATCLTTGSWNTTIPTCIRCDNLTSTDVLSVVVSSDGVLSSAVFECATGYQLVGGRNATCNITGAWSQVPYCDCETPVTPDGGTMMLNDTTAKFTCDVGYNMIGSDTMICQDDGTGWSDVSPSCNACTGLAAPMGGYYNMTSDGYVTIATFTCHVGFSLSGTQILFCQTDGSWNSTEPQCVQCPNLTTPSSGEVNITTDGQTTVAYYSCMEGYNMTGASTSICLLDGTWSEDPPTCSCSPAVVPADGSILSDDGTYVYYACNVNYSMHGDAVRECYTNGSGWSGQDTVCVGCDSLAAVSGGAVELSTDGINTKAVYKCDVGYSIHGNTRITCLSNGSWDAEQSYCTKCADLSVPSNGNYTMFSDVQTVTKAAFRCDIGYTLVGYSEITCESSGTWNRASPTCVKCQSRDHPDSGNFTLATDGLQTTGLYTCAEGYELNGATTVSCTTTGFWNSPESTCECIQPSAPANGSMVVDQPSVLYTCDLGFSMDGDSTGVCNTDSTGWSIDTPQCVECGNVGNVNNGTITYWSDGVTTMIEVTCNTGTSIRGNSLIKCNADGTWDSLLLECVSCVDLPELSVTSGSVTIATNGTTTTASYGCPVGYEVQGSQTVQCLPNGTWSDTTTTCVCEPPVLPEGAGYNITADGMTVTYACDVGYTIDGVLTSQCATDGSGWMLDYPNCTTCEAVDSPQHGSVTLVTNSTHTSVKYWCNVGYTLNAEPTDSVCQPDGTWTITTPSTCVLCDSLPPLSVDNGNVTLETNGTHTTASYSCPVGYEIKGLPTMGCNTDGTWDNSPSDCVCETPPDVTGGNVSIAEDGLSVTFSCDEGYTINGNQEITCSTDGSGWTSAYPECAMCDVITAPDNGNVSVVTNGTVSIAVYTCDAGSSISGVSVAECQADGTWNISEPTCVTCPTLPGITISTGSIDIITDGAITTAVYHCPPGYEVLGSQNITCNRNGSWSEQPSDCVCETPALPTGGNYTLSADSMTVVFQCSEGYTMDGDQTVTCSVDGSGWDITQPNCTRCEDLTPLYDGNVKLITNGTQSIAIYSCNVGTTLSGDHQRECSKEGIWTASQPECVRCADVHNISSGMVSVSTNGTTTTAVYTCSHGYSLSGQSILTCLFNTSWDGDTPTCYCIPPNSPMSGSVIANTTMALYYCNEGFVLSGPSVRICQDDGLGWSDDTPTCASCDTLYAPANGSVSFNSDGYVTTAVITCNVGFTINGTDNLVCLEDGSWSNTLPYCVLCAELPDPVNGTALMSTNGTHTVTTFTCDVGTSMIGSQTSTCLADTTWSHAEPSCALCPILTAPHSGIVNMSSDGVTTTAHFSCVAGYYMEGSDLIVCVDNETWSDVTPSCFCDDPVLSNGHVSSDGRNVTFNCDSGYSLSGNSTLECQNDGNGWNDYIPLCVECIGIVGPTGGVYTMSTDGINTQATFQCNIGRSLNGSEVLQCNADGEWNASVPFCVECDDLPSPSNGQFVMSSDGTMTSVELTCNDGYVASGVTNVQCREDGTWYYQSESTCELSETTDNSLLTILIVVSIGSVVVIVILSVLLARFVYLYFRNKSYNADKYTTSDISPFDSSENVSNGIWKTPPSIKILQSKAPAGHQRHVMETASPFAPSPAPDGFVKSPELLDADTPPPIETHRSGTSIISFRRTATTLTKNSLASVSAITISQDKTIDSNQTNGTNPLPTNGTLPYQTNGTKPINGYTELNKPPNRLTPLPNHRERVGKLNTRSASPPDSGRKSQSETRSGTPLVMKHSIVANNFDSKSMDSVSIIDD